MDKIPPLLKKYRSGEKLVMITAYDYPSALLASQTDVDILLVGDSLGMVIQGNDSTRPVTLEQMCYHTSIVVKGAGNKAVVVDLPYGTYDTVKEGLEASKYLMALGASGVKYEGDKPELAAALKSQGIPLMGHLGLLPQTASSFKVQGKEEAAAVEMVEAAKRLEAQGAFSIVLECIPTSLGTRITESLKIPTIGIGAGPYTSGQVLVWHDLLGVYQGKKARFVREYLNLGKTVPDALNSFAQDVKQGTYPNEGEQYL
jgi:3-methyl-2-oxobutanoate hydroxymethyltransferase